MSDTKTITKSLAGLEDILLGINTAQQNRAGQTVVVHKARIPVAVDNNTKLAAVDPTFSEYAVVVNSEGSSFYVYVPDTSGAVKSTVAAGSWKYEFVKSIMDIVDLAVYPKVGNFETGTIVHTNNEAVFYPGTVNLPFGTNTYWIYNGAIPPGGLIVPALSTPDSNWTNIGAGTNMDYFNQQFNEFKDYVNAALANNDVAKYQNMNVKLLADANRRLMQGNALTIVCLGDSMTAGFDTQSNDKVPATNGDWATHAPIEYPQAVALTLNQCTSSSVTAINRGYSGDTAKQGYDRWTTNPNGHVVHIMFGINDSGGVAGATYSEYVEYMEKLIRRYIDWGHGVVLHTCTAQSFDNGPAIARPYSEATRSLARSYNCPVFESEMETQYGLYAGIYSDGTHFNKQGYYKYGRAVAAFIMSGRYIGAGNPVTGLTHQSPGRRSDEIGYFAKGVTYATTGGSYLWNGNSTTIPANGSGSIAFAFYCDMDLAEISLVGHLVDIGIALAQVATEDRPEYANRGVQSINRLPLRRNTSLNVTETTGVIVGKGRDGARSNDTAFGYAVGKGWKILQVFFNGTQTADRYLNGIIIKPARMRDASQTTNLDGRPATIDSYSVQLPRFGQSADATIIPPAVVLGTVSVPLPSGLAPWNTDSSVWFTSHPVYVDVLVRGSTDNGTNPNGFARFMVYQTGASTFVIERVAGLTTIIAPTTVAVRRADTDFATGNTGAYSDGYPVDTQTGALALTFPTKAAAYYTIVVHGLAPAQSQQGWLG